MIVLPKQWVLRTGTFDADTGRFTVNKKHIDDVAWCINKRCKLGVPVTLKYTHSQNEQAIGVGLMDNALVKDGQVYADLKITQPATKDFGDGRGKVLLATVEEIASSIKDKTMQLSLEGTFDVTSPSYYGDRTLGLEITSWAVLPAGTLPAVPQIAATGKKGNRVTIVIAEAEEKKTSTTTSEGEATAAPEEIQKEEEEKTEELSIEDQLANLLKRIKELEETVGGLQKKSPAEEKKEEPATTEENKNEEEKTEAARVQASSKIVTESLAKVGVKEKDFEQFCTEIQQFPAGIGSPDLTAIIMDSFNWTKVQAEEVIDLYYLMNNTSFSRRNTNQIYAEEYPKGKNRTEDKIIEGIFGDHHVELYIDHSEETYTVTVKLDSVEVLMIKKRQIAYPTESEARQAYNSLRTESDCEDFLFLFGAPASLRRIAYGDRKFLEQKTRGNPRLRAEAERLVRDMPSLRAKKPMLESRVTENDTGTMEKAVNKICSERGLSRANAFDVWCKENPVEANKWIK